MSEHNCFRRWQRIGCGLFALAFLLLLPGCDNRYNDGFGDGYKKGFEDGRASGYSTGYSEGVKKGHDQGHQEGLAEAASLYARPKLRDLRTLGGLLIEGRGDVIVFWLLATLNTLALLAALIFLVFRLDDTRIRIAKGLMFGVASLCWFRFVEPSLVSAGFLVAERDTFGPALLEVAFFAFAIVVSLVFDKYFLRDDREHVWADIIGVAFGTLLFFLLIHLMLNARLILAAGMQGEPLHYVGAFAGGGLLYSVYALVNAYILERDRPTRERGRPATTGADAERRRTRSSGRSALESRHDED